MRIVSHGIDLVETARIAAVLADHPQRFLDRCFTPLEVGEAGTGPRRNEHLAGRFAAKEGVLKALGTGLSGGVLWTDVEVARQPSGAPCVRLRGSAAARAAELGIAQWMVSISHTAGIAVASVIAIAPNG